MELQEKCKIIEDIFNIPMADKPASAMISRADPTSGIWLTLRKHEFHPWDSILIASWMEEIFAKTDMIWVALNKNDDSVTITLHDCQNLSGCNFSNFEDNICFTT